MNTYQLRERILVVDDEQIIRELLKRVLGREGYQVTTTPCSEDAVRLMSIKSFDLAIVDAGYRNSNGCKLMKMVRKASPETAMVVMTGYPVAEVIRFAQEHAQGYLEKPFDLQEFLAAVRSALAEVLMRGSEARPAKII
jgi:DNA-binding NtrC family response regulator